MNEMELVFGDIHDNLAVFDLAVAEFMYGRVREGLRILIALRDHILEGRDPASQRVLLPPINAKLAEVSDSRKLSARHTVSHKKSRVRSGILVSGLGIFGSTGKEVKAYELTIDFT